MSKDEYGPIVLVPSVSYEDYLESVRSRIETDTGEFRTILVDTERTNRDDPRFQLWLEAPVLFDGKRKIADLYSLHQCEDWLNEKGLFSRQMFDYYPET